MTITFNAWWIVGLLIVCPVIVEAMLPREYGWGAGCRGALIIGTCWLLAVGVAVGKVLA
jgi:hypothetical protein